MWHIKQPERQPQPQWSQWTPLLLPVQPQTLNHHLLVYKARKIKQCKNKHYEILTKLFRTLDCLQLIKLPIRPTYKCAKKLSNVWNIIMKKKVWKSLISQSFVLSVFPIFSLLWMIHSVIILNPDCFIKNSNTFYEGNINKRRTNTASNTNVGYMSHFCDIWIKAIIIYTCNFCKHVLPIFYKSAISTNLSTVYLR